MFAYKIPMPFHDNPVLIARQTTEDKARIDILGHASNHAGLIEYLNRGSRDTRHYAIEKLLQIDPSAFPASLKQPTLKHLYGLMDRLAADESARKLVLKAHELGEKLGATKDAMKKNMLNPRIIDKIIEAKAESTVDYS